MPDQLEQKEGIARRLHRFFIPSRHNEYHPHLLGRDALMALFALAVIAEGFWFVASVVQQSGVRFLAAVQPAVVLALTNTERSHNNVGPLADNSLLDTAAQAKANDMAAQGYFSHVSPDGTMPWDWIARAGYNYSYAGENLAVRFSESGDVVNAWMASPAHRANILKADYREVGIGIAEGSYQGSPATFVVQFFGTKEETSAVTATAVSTTTGHVARASRPAPVLAATATSSDWNVPAGRVEGISVAAVKVSQSSANTLARQIVDSLSSYRQGTIWFFAVLAILLLVAITNTLVVHAHAGRQPRHLVLSGAMALCFLSIGFTMFNSSVVTGVGAFRNTADVFLGTERAAEFSLQAMAATSTKAAPSSVEMIVAPRVHSGIIDAI